MSFPNVIYKGNHEDFGEKYTISGSTISKWCMNLIFYHFEVLMWATQPPSMSSKLLLEVIELEIIFFAGRGDLLGVFIRRGDTLDFHCFAWSETPKSDHQNSKVKVDIDERSLLLPGGSTKLLVCGCEHWERLRTDRNFASVTPENSKILLTIRYIP